MTQGFPKANWFVWGKPLALCCIFSGLEKAATRGLRQEVFSL